LKTKMKLSHLILFVFIGFLHNTFAQPLMCSSDTDCIYKCNMLEPTFSQCMSPMSQKVCFSTRDDDPINCRSTTNSDNEENIVVRWHLDDSATVVGGPQHASGLYWYEVSNGTYRCWSAWNSRPDGPSWYSVHACASTTTATMSPTSKPTTTTTTTTTTTISSSQSMTTLKTTAKSSPTTTKAGSMVGDSTSSKNVDSTSSTSNENSPATITVSAFLPPTPLTKSTSSSQLLTTTLFQNQTDTADDNNNIDDSESTLGLAPWLLYTIIGGAALLCIILLLLLVCCVIRNRRNYDETLSYEDSHGFGRTTEPDSELAINFAGYSNAFNPAPSTTNNDGVLYEQLPADEQTSPVY